MAAPWSVSFTSQHWPAHPASPAVWENRNMGQRAAHRVTGIKRTRGIVTWHFVVRQSPHITSFLILEAFSSWFTLAKDLASFLHHACRSSGSCLVSPPLDQPHQKTVLPLPMHPRSWASPSSVLPSVSRTGTFQWPLVLTSLCRLLSVREQPGPGISCLL